MRRESTFTGPRPLLTGEEEAEAHKTKKHQLEHKSNERERAKDGFNVPVALSFVFFFFSCECISRVRIFPFEGVARVIHCCRSTCYSQPVGEMSSKMMQERLFQVPQGVPLGLEAVYWCLLHKSLRALARQEQQVEERRTGCRMPDENNVTRATLHTQAQVDKESGKCITKSSHASSRSRKVRESDGGGW